MGAKGITNGRAYSDLRLTLERSGRRLISALSFFDDAAGTLNARYESEPDWDLLNAGLLILRQPELHSDESISPMGEELGRAAFGPPILATLVAHLDARHVRLWLRPEGELAQFPWEACSFQDGDGPATGILSMHPGLSLIRDVGGVALPPRQPTGRTRVLVAWADPSSTQYPHLPGIEREVRSVMRALGTAECSRFTVDEVQFATPASLSRSIQALRPDIVHFIGHGDTLATGGVLVLESGNPNQESLLHGDELAKILAGAQVQLIVLSGCMTGDAITGVGTEVALAGLPAVVAMQAPLHDASAGLFARALYGTLGSGESIDEAVLEGRCAIRGSGNDWAVPVVMRTPFEGPRFEQDLDFDFVPAMPEKRHNLAYDDRPFIGRQLERLEIRDRICLKRQRLVTITGMGGMGKTRLSKQIASEVLDDFPDGVWMVECDALDGREELIGAIASVLGVPNSGGQVEDSIVQSLASKKLLLVLDCFERLVEHADVVDHILKEATDCQALVTSRVVLGLQREFEYRLSPMTLKKKGADQSDGVSLFVEAASHAVNSFELTAKTRPIVQELCRELEGVPLALVLAAGRLRHLSLMELLEQVRLHPLEVLRRRGGPRDKQADLYRVVASSFLLLGPQECAVLDKLSVFVGSFFAEDAAEVCGVKKVDLLHSLSTLRDHSLVQVQSRIDRTHYKLLDTVREFLDQLPRDDVEQEERRRCEMRHAERYARSADEIRTLLSQGRWTEGTSQIWSEIGNLRAAFKYASANGRHELIRSLATGLARPYFDMALYADFEQLSAAGLASAASLGDRTLEARLLGLEGAYAAIRKDEASSQALWTKRLEICQSTGDMEGATDALCDLAWDSFGYGRIDEARERLAGAVKIAEQAKNFGLIARCSVERAQIDLKMGDLEAVRRQVDEASRLIAGDENKLLVLYICQHLVALNEALDDGESAFDSCVKMLNLAFEVHRYRNTAWALLKLAELHEKRNENDLAMLCYLAAVRLQSEFASRQGEKSKPLLASFLTRHGDLKDRFLSVHKKASWRSLIRALPYVPGAPD